MRSDPQTVFAVDAIIFAVTVIIGAAVYALRRLKQTENDGLKSLRDIVRIVYHGKR